MPSCKALAGKYVSSQTAVFQLLGAETASCSLLGVLLQGLERLHLNLETVSRPKDLLVSTKSPPLKCALVHIRAGASHFS